VRDSESTGRRLKLGLRLCWLSVALLPIGLLAIGGGPCAGPRNAAGSAILLATGCFSFGLAAYGIFRVGTGGGGTTALRGAWAAVSMCCAGLAGLVASFYLLSA
jgi:hypothetical protein